MKRIKLAFLFLFVVTFCQAQNDPSFRQFYFNPFHFNPAYTGIDGHTDIYMAVRKQWIDFKDAPLVSQFSIQYPTRGRVSLGFTVFDQEVVALQNTFISTAFAYRVPLAVNKSLIFALNGGVGVSNLDLENYDYSNDPAVMNAATASVYGNAGFGVLYEWNRLKVGFALPQLFGQAYISPRKLGDRNFSQLQKQNYSVSYKFFASSLSFEPWFLFRLSNDNQNAWDIGTTVSFREVVWVGSSFSAQQGTGFFFGMDIKDVVKIGYAYELPPANIGFIQTKSMEFQLRVRLSPKRGYQWRPKATKLAKPQDQTKPVETNPSIISERANKKDTTVKSQMEKDSLVNKESAKQLIKIETDIKSNNSDTIKINVKPGYYLVTGSFKNPNYASDVLNNLKDKGYRDGGFFFHKKEGLYQVYLYYSSNLQSAKSRYEEYLAKKINCSILKID